MVTSKPKYLVVSGATATGKTSCSISLARFLKENDQLEIEIINFDSLLFYKDLNIGTAKPSLIERQGVAHHLIDIATISTPLNASQFIELCEPCLEDIWQRGHTPLLVGGSGFYLNALQEGMYPGGTPSDEIKKQVQNILETQGTDEIIRLLKQYDPASALKLHANDEYRLTRALEFYLHSGDPISQASQKFEQEKENLQLGLKRKAQGLHFNLVIEKEDHFSLICARTKTMLEQGLMEEVKDILLRQSITGDEKPLLSIGYKQALMYLNGEFSSLEEMEERINIATRQLAKAQRTWFKTHPGDHQYDVRTGQNSINKQASDFLKS